MILEENEVDVVEDRYFKEKDLKNHLEAVPDLEKNETEPEEPAIDSEKESEADDTTGYKILKLKKLMVDNQVMRALDILLGYNVFKELQK